MIYQSKENTRKIIIGLIIAWFIASMITGGEDILRLLLTIPGLFLAITVHEYAHALIAYKLGDITPKNQGRITLNPLKHVDPVGILFLFTVGIGWGRPVEYNPNNILGKEKLEKAEAKIAIAGPVANIITAFILAIIYILLINIFGVNLNYYFITIIQIALSLNVSLALFNLIPIPPLDGYKVFYPLLKKTSYPRFVKENSILISIAFLIFIFTNAYSVIITPVFAYIMDVILNIASALVGIFF